jgi:hypothetical protein
MTYAKHVSERVIIIALVDMTQDLVNYKTLGESKQALTDIKKDKLEKLEKKETIKDEPKEIELYTKFDLDSLIQNSTTDMLKSFLSNNITMRKLKDAKMSNIKDKHCVQFNNEFTVKDDKLKWSLVISAQTLSMISNLKNNDKSSMLIDTIDNNAKALSQSMTKSMIDIVKLRTENKVELNISNMETKEKILFGYGSSLREIQFTLDNQQFEFYILIEAND